MKFECYLCGEEFENTLAHSQVDDRHKNYIYTCEWVPNAICFCGGKIKWYNWTDNIGQQRWEAECMKCKTLWNED